MKEDLAIAKNSLLALYDENRQLRQELGREAKTEPVILSAQITNVPEMDGISKSADIAELKQRLEEERKLRQEAEKELDLQVICAVLVLWKGVWWWRFCAQLCLKAEMEVAMKLLEKDIHEKQDTIMSLRRQLDDIKLINLEMYKKLQVSF